MGKADDLCGDNNIVGTFTEIHQADVLAAVM
jgi:hypothetical protein